MNNRLKNVMAKHDPLYFIKSSIKSYRISKSWNVDNEITNKSLVKDYYNDIVPNRNILHDRHLAGIIDALKEKNNGGIYLYDLDSVIYNVSIVDIKDDKITILKDHLNIDFTQDFDEKIIYTINSRRRIDIIFDKKFDYKNSLNIAMSNIPTTMREFI